MQIFIMRHGEASYQDVTSNRSDALRPLTTLGEFEAKRMGQWLASTETNTIEIFVRPYLRAQQT